MKPYFVPILTRDTGIQVGYAGEFDTLGAAIRCAREHNAEPANRNFRCPVWELGPVGSSRAAVVSVPYKGEETAK